MVKCIVKEMMLMIILVVLSNKMMMNVNEKIVIMK